MSLAKRYAHPTDLKELSEKIQNDLIAYLDGMSEELIDEVCLIVAKNCVKKEN